MHGRILKEAGSEEILYVGTSRNGVARPTDPKHQAVAKFAARKISSSK
jgi:hypothetical protein